MTSFLRIAALAAVGASLVGCASGPGYYGPGPGPVAVVRYDGWYDGYYGPIYDGYWRGGVFWWRDREGREFRRDDGRHFSRQSAPGRQHIQGERHPDHR